MATSKEDAQEAIFKAVKEIVEGSASLNGSTRASIVKNAALAYRFAAGGQQPGSVASESK